MVFPGRFSTGCMRCRQRKVKCDETKPSCRRCYIYGKPCPGYTDQFHFRHGLNSASFPVSSTPSTDASPPPPPTRVNSVAPQRRKSGSSTDDEQHAASQNQGQHNGQTHGQNHNQNQQQGQPQSQALVQSRAMPAIAPHIDLSDDQVTLSYFVRRFVSPDGDDSFPGHLTFLPEIFNHYGHGLLEVATLSVAQMAAYNQFGCDRFRLQSYRNYGRALGILQGSLASNQEVTDDRVLAAVLLLCTYKDMSGEGSGDPSDHAAGIFYLLERRGFEQLATRRGFELFILSLLRLQIYSYLHDDDSYSDPGGMVQLLGAFDPLMRAMGLVSRTLQLRHALARCSGSGIQVMDDGASPGSQISPQEEIDAPLIEECFRTLHEFGDWDTDAALYWKSTFEGRAVPTALGEVAMGAHYYDPETACTIILVRSSRLILLLSMLEYHDRMVLAANGAFRPVGSGWTDCIPALEHDIRATIDDMLSCVPYALGDVDPSGRPVTISYDGAGALVILQPIRLVTSCRYATPQQLMACDEILRRLNTTMGIKAAIGLGMGETDPALSWVISQRASDAGLTASDGSASPLQSPLTS